MLKIYSENSKKKKPQKLPPPDIPVNLLIDAMKNKKKITIKILKEVQLEFDNYNKDMQRLVSAETFFVDLYHSKNQCLHNVSGGGRSMTIKEWEEAKIKREEEKMRGQG